jgi:hypothetical protein
VSPSPQTLFVSCGLVPVPGGAGTRNGPSEFGAEKSSAKPRFDNLGWPGTHLLFQNLRVRTEANR